MENSELDEILGPPPGNGKSLDEQIKELVDWYGADMVRESVARLAKKTRGRKMATDWDEISYTLELDAHDWLSGKDPFKIRTNYSIAKAASDANPGHSYLSTFRRLMGELAKRREYLVYLLAWGISQDGYPYPKFFMAVDALCKDCPDWVGDFTKSRDEKLQVLKAYRERFGEPDPNMTLKQIENRLENVSEDGDSNSAN